MTIDLPSIHRGYALSIGVFVTTTVVLVVQLLSPSSVVITGAERSAELTITQSRGTLVTVVVACAFGSSGTYLFLNAPTDSDATHASTVNEQPRSRGTDTEGTDDLLEARRQEWEATAEKLSDREEAVYRVVLDADGVLPQSEIVERAGRSKATVSRALDSLEAKDLVERKRRGVGNIVVLK